MDKNADSKNLLSVLSPLIIIVIVIFVCFGNYSTGTFLTGWDTLHPEFNYGIYWTRIIFGAWQSHQGLGAAASQAHASEIPRIILLNLLDLFFHADFIRYLYAFLMLFIGPLGAYFYLKKTVLRSVGETFSSLGGLFGALFYLLNLVTLQQFNVPLEMFLTHYGFLPWSFLFLTEFYQSGKKTDLLKFVLVSFLLTSQAHTPTLFYVYFMSLVVYLVFLFLPDLLSKRGKEEKDFHFQIRRGLVILVGTLAINFFWFLPSMYYGAVHSGEVPLAKITHLFSEEAFLVNKKYGNLRDTSILKNFLFDWGVFTGGNTYQDLLSPWILHLKKPLVPVVGYIFFAFVVIGLVVSLRRKNIFASPWTALFLTGIFFIFNVNPPFGFIFKFLQDIVPLFKELFRFPFTKFSIILMFSYAVFFGIFVSFFTQFLAKKISRLVGITFMLVVFSGLFYFSLPTFKGFLINPAMRVSIPDRYFEMFGYFDSQSEYGRVADLPIHSFWGWVFHSWDFLGTGYQGAGFLWFGIKQPLIDREFDRWNIANEQPYRELSTAIYSENPDSLIKALEKDKIRWLILDESVVAPGYDRKVLFYDGIRKLLGNTPGMALDRDFGEGLYVYKYSPKTDYYRTERISSYHIVGNSLFKEYSDPAYLEFGNYISGPQQNYQFLGFNSVDENIDNSLVFSDENKVYFKLPKNETDVSTDKIPVSVYLMGSEARKYLELRFENTAIGKFDINNVKSEKSLAKIDNEIFDLSQPKKDGFVGSLILTLGKNPLVRIYEMGEKKEVENFFYSKLENCDPLEGGNYSTYSFMVTSTGFEISARDTLSCVTLPLTDVASSGSSNMILVTFESNIPITSNDFCMLNTVTGLCVDKFLEGGYFVADLTEDRSKYTLRFFADARNSNEEFKRSYSNIVFSDASLDQEGSIVISSDNLRMSGYLTFDKQDQFTVNPSNMKGNRRNCTMGTQLEKSNFFDSGKGLVFNSTESSLCDSYNFPLAEHNTGYVLEVKAVYIDGVPLRVCLTNEYSKRCDLEVSLPANKLEGTYFYILPPMGNGAGYTVNISNYVFGNTLSKNELRYISLVPVAYNLIKDTKISEPPFVQKENLYVLNEAYDPGWLVLCGIRFCAAEHVKVNNWSNGWVFESNIPSNIKVVFWPQLLEYLGIALWIPILIFSFRYREKEVDRNTSDYPNSLEPHSVDNIE